MEEEKQRQMRLHAEQEARELEECVAMGRAEEESIGFELMHEEAKETARIEQEMREKDEREAMAKADDGG